MTEIPVLRGGAREQARSLPGGPRFSPAASAAESAGCPLPGIEQVWRRTLGDPRVTIAILDGPADLAHPALAGARLETLGGPGKTCRGAAACLHGTHVASLIFAQHGAGPLKGVAPLCRGILIPVFSDDPAAPGAVRPCSQRDLARAIEAAAGYGAHVINISAGQPGHSGTADPLLARAVELCARRGVLIAAAAGNDGCDCLHLPAALPAVLTVGAHGPAGDPSESSNFGAAYRTQGIVAPGVSVLGASPGGGYQRRSGTSFAVPLVAGLAGLLLSARLGRQGRLTPHDAREARDAILASAAPCDFHDPRECRRLLAGRVVPPKAFRLYLKGAVDMDQLASNLPLEPNAAAPAGLAAAGPVPSCACQPPESGSPAGPPDEETGPDEEVAAASRQPPRVRTARTPPAARPARGLAPSECACGQKGGLVYALGEMGFDFGSQARLDAISAAMDVGKSASFPRDLLEFINAERGGNLHYASAILWTLNHDSTPFYVVRPEGAFARETYTRLLEFFADQIDSKAERISVAGVTDGTVTLFSGQQVPVLIPDLRSLYNWRTADLVASVAGEQPKDDSARQQFETKVEGMRGFLERIYFELRNEGQTPQERALNFAATNAFNIERVFESAARRQLQLDEIGVDRSPICRPDSDCWDVRLIFFDPADALGRARTVYRFTVDVSDVVPVLVGPVRSWAMR